MTSGDFAIGLSTIISGLAITVMLSSIHALLVNRRKVKWDWVALTAAAFVFMLIVGSWGVGFRILANRPINPPLWLFLFMLGGIIPMYLAARAALPDQLLDEGIDLKAHYHAVSRYLWLSIGVSFLLYVAWAALRLGMAGLHRQWLVLAQLLFVVPLAVSRRRRVHELLVPVVFALFCLHHLNEPLFA